MADNYSVLIVDDSFADRFLLKRMLSTTGLDLTIVEAADGKIALELLTRPLDNLKAQFPKISAPITLFLDVNMPVMDGWTFLQELKIHIDEVQLKPSIVIMYTTADATQNRRKAKAYDNVQNYMIKGEPTPEHLKSAILACHPEKSPAIDKGTGALT